MKSLGELVKRDVYPVRSFFTLKDEMVEPEKVANFKKVMPGAEDRIFAMMEKEQQHRHELEKKQVETWSRIAILKTWGLIIAGGIIVITSIVLILQGYLKEGLTLIGGSGFASLIKGGYKFIREN